MKAPSLGLCAALALAAPSAAFLIPSTSEAFADREFSLIDPSSQLLTLDCEACLFAGSADEDLVWVQGIENSLLLNFSVVDGHSVELNGIQLYPPTFDALPQPIPVYQVRADIPLTDIRANIGKYTDRPLRISAYGLEIDPAVTASSGDELIPMTLQLSSLEGRHINVPSLSVKLMKHPEGDISILPITTAAPIDDSSPQKDDKECKNWPVICKWRAIVADRIQSMKGSLQKVKGGCMKGRPHSAASGKPAPSEDRPEEVEQDDERPPHRLSGQHKPHHGPHGIMRHHRSGPLARFFRIIGKVMIPIFIGFAVGALTYATGWLVGCVIAYFWIRYNARRAGGYAAVAADEEDVAVKEEIPQDAPPVYAEKEVVPEEEEEEGQH